MRINYQKIKNTVWYRQGAAAKPLYVSYPLIACNSFTMKGKPVPVFYKNIIIEIKDGHMTDFLDRANLKQITNYYLTRQKRNSIFIQSIKRHWEKNNVEPFLKKVKNIDDLVLSDLSNKELVKLFVDFSKDYMSVWRNSIFLDSFDTEGDHILQNCISEAKLNSTNDEIQLLISNQVPSILQQERLDVLKLTEDIIKNKKIKNIVQISQVKQIKINAPNIYQSLVQLSGKYHWLYNDYHTISHLDEKYFLGNIKKLLRSEKSLAEERAFKNDLQSIKVDRNKLIKKGNITSKIQNILDMLVILARWRDERKAYMQIGNSVIEKFAVKFSQRIGVDQNMIEYLLWPELVNIFNSNATGLKRIKNRQNQGMVGIIARRNHIYWVSSIEARKIVAIPVSQTLSKTEIKGSPAYPGIVKAKTKIILGKKDFHKLKRGEILVAPNTRPEYVPIMKIAGAIISEEGGVTCHAAIVSRELKKPAIVGVQGVLDVLEDGDLVQVDAERGIVQKLS